MCLFERGCWEELYVLRMGCVTDIIDCYGKSAELVN
jgi:hypothetical protein